MKTKLWNECEELTAAEKAWLRSHYDRTDGRVHVPKADTSTKTDRMCQNLYEKNAIRHWSEDDNFDVFNVNPELVK